MPKQSKYALVIDPELWARFKAKCALHRISMVRWITRAIKKWVEEEEK